MFTFNYLNYLKLVLCLVWFETGLKIRYMINRCGTWGLILTHRSPKARLEFVDNFVSIFKGVWLPMCVVLFRTGLKYLIVINVWVGSQKPTRTRTLYTCTGQWSCSKLLHAT